MLDPFGLSPQTNQDQGKQSKYQWLHNVLDGIGIFFDAADLVNAGIYALEGDWGNAALSAVSLIPMVGTVVVGVAKSAKMAIKARKAAKIAELAAESSRMTAKAADALDTFHDTMKVVGKYGKDAVKYADNIAKEAAPKIAKALETSCEFGKETKKAVKSVEAATSVGGLRLSTHADEAAAVLKKTDFYVRPNGDIVHATGYRYLSSSNYDSVLITGENYTTYIGFEKIESAAEVRDRYQVSINWSDCKVRCEFDTLQVIDDIYVPTTLGNTTTIPEPFAVSYPEFGKGGAQQFRVDTVVKFKKIVLLEE